MSLLSDLDVGRTVIGKFSTLARPLGLLTVMMLSMAMNRFNGLEYKMKKGGRMRNRWICGGSGGGEGGAAVPMD